jgi:L-aspartate oxidase
VTAGWEVRVDAVVVGTGVAGLSCALDAAAFGLSVLVVTKNEVDDTNTRYAQGGIAVVEGTTGDRISDHLSDTLIAGAGLCDEVATWQILQAGPGSVARLRARGARFDSGPAGLLRTREGGHRADRIIHAGGDATGAEVQRTLESDSKLPAVLTDHLAIDLALSETGCVAGLYVLDPDGGVGLIRAGAVVLATGGSGQLFAASTNPSVATADGVAMALRAGAAVADLEFIQFHPTALWTGAAASGRRDLVTEAIRGAGATLVDGAGRPVMAGIHPLGDLAPRDVVSLAVTRRLAENPGGIGDHVFLDCRSVADFDRRFPTVAASCAVIGVRPGVDPIPVSPAAHYACGGVWTDGLGRTTVPGLFAAGEVARTGLHGANRLASNSLLEGLVMGERVAQALAAGPTEHSANVELQPLSDSWYAPNWRIELQAAMSRHAGIGRDADGLRAVRRESDRVCNSRSQLSREAVEATNLAQVSAVLTAAAAARTESRGCHVRTDAPHESRALNHSLFAGWRDNEPVISAHLASARLLPVLSS